MPGHIIQAAGGLSVFSPVFNVQSRWRPLPDGGAIVYEFNPIRAFAEFMGKLDAIPAVRERAISSGTFTLGTTEIAWLPIYESFQEEGTPRSFTGLQKDILHFSIDSEDSGVFSVRTALRSDIGSEQWERRLGECAVQSPMDSHHVRFWITFAKKPRSEDLKYLRDGIERWASQAEREEPPVGGKVILHGLESDLLGERSTKPALFCDVDLSGGRQETFEWLLALLATASETSVPLDEILVALLG